MSVNETEKEVEAGPVDLRKNQYYAFVVPASQKKQDGFVECIIADEDDAFPFLAQPLTKKPTFDQLRDYVGGHLTSVVPAALLRKHGYNIAYADDEGLLKPNPQYNVDASAFTTGGFGSLCGDVVFCREGKVAVKKAVPASSAGRAGAAKKKTMKK